MTASAELSGISITAMSATAPITAPSKTASAGGYVGGIVGYLNNKDGKVHNCYNYGSVQNGGGNYCGAIIGWLRNSGAAANLTDNCYLTGSAASAFGTGSVSTAAAVPVMIRPPLQAARYAIL